MKKFLNNTVIIILLILLMIGGVMYHINVVGKKDAKYSSEVKLRNALQDSMTLVQNEKGEWEAEKLTLQGDIDYLLSANIKLSNDQQELLERVKEEQKHSNIISAALVRAQIMLDSMDNVSAVAAEIDTINNTVRFMELDTTQHFQYDISVMNVLPDPTYNPILEFDYINFPNDQFITFQWEDDKRADYPTSFTVRNSNKYFQVNNIESYAIPELQKNEVNPSWSLKTWRWIKINGKYVLVCAAGVAVGMAIK